MRQIRHFIAGQFVSSRSGRTFPDHNPATGEAIAEVAEGGAEDIARAVEAARRAFEGPWRKLGTSERCAILRRIGDLILEHRDELAQLETEDVGKPIDLSRDLEIPRAANNFHFFSEFAKGLATEAFPTEGVMLNYTLRRPLGVAALITPWNLPLLLLTWKLAPCLAAGNTAVAKPAELTPLTATRLAELTAEAGLPDGVFNVVHGFGPEGAGEALTRHPDVNLISFTGETATGQAIMSAAAPTLKRLSFELGGKNPNLIFADADLEETLATSVRCGFFNSGQICLSGSRILVEEPIYHDFVGALVGRVRELRLGDPAERQTSVGPLISPEHLERVEGYLQLARAEGARILCGGGRPSDLPRRLAQGNFLEPTVITDMHSGSRLLAEEIFGPVVTVEPFESEEEALQKANGTKYGLSATLWTSNLKRAHRLAERLDAGIVWVNTWYVRDLRTPFGGMKQSGIGREGGVHSFDFFTEPKNVCVKL